VRDKRYASKFVEKSPMPISGQDKISRGTPHAAPGRSPVAQADRGSADRVGVVAPDARQLGRSLGAEIETKTAPKGAAALQAILGLFY
jgi:hypothetical protein